MSSDWFFPVKIAMPWESFRRLPRHPAYRYEYRGEEALVSGRPQYLHCWRGTAPGESGNDAVPSNPSSFLPDFGLQLLSWEEGTGTSQQKDDLLELFRESFAESPPFFALGQDEQKLAAFESFGGSIAGFSGCPVNVASFVIRQRESSLPVAALLVTLVPPGDWTDFSDSGWETPSPKDPIRSRWGHAHLTWVFVSPRWRRRGLGEFLLRKSLSQLDDLRYEKLFSTFMLGDHASMLWHWKQKFQLLPSISSARFR